MAVTAAAALLVQTTAFTYRIWNWRSAVVCAALGTFVLGAVGLGALVAGWTAPSGVALGLALGIAWATVVELLLEALGSQRASPAAESDPRTTPDS